MEGRTCKKRLDDAADTVHHYRGLSCQSVKPGPSSLHSKQVYRCSHLLDTSKYRDFLLCCHSLRFRQQISLINVCVYGGGGVCVNMLSEVTVTDP